VRPEYGDTCFLRPEIYVCCKNSARGRESVVDEERPGRPVVSTVDTTIAGVESLKRSDQE